MTLIYEGSYKTKKDLKSKGIGQYFSFSDPSIFVGKNHPLEGDVVVIDHPKRSKFAQIWTDADGLLIRVI